MYYWNIKHWIDLVFFQIRSGGGGGILLPNFLGTEQVLLTEKTAGVGAGHEIGKTRAI